MPVTLVAGDDGVGGGTDAAAGQVSRPLARPAAETGTGTAGRVLSVVDATLHNLMRGFPGEAELARFAKQGQRRGAGERSSRKDDYSGGGAAGCGGTAADAATGAGDDGLHLDDL